MTWVGTASARSGLDRTVLPIAEPKRPFYNEIDARHVKPRYDLKALAGAPNAVIVLIDDLGFGVSGAFGGPGTTSPLDRLGQNGPLSTNFHTTALGSPLERR
jgi:arylsulfatase